MSRTNSSRQLFRARKPSALTLLTAIAAALALNHQLRADDFSFTDFSDVSLLTLNGDAAQVGGVLRVAPDLEGRSGSAWYSDAKAHVIDGFDTTFTYKMSGANPEGADGFAFLIQDESIFALGGSGSDLGYGGGITRSIAIEFDTFGFFPETDNHISVNSRGTASNDANDTYSLAQVNPFINLNDGNTHSVTIRYRPGMLLVFIDGGNAPILDVAVNLTDIAGENILDGSGDAWVGFTAATGALFQNHDIFDWSFDENSNPLPTGACCIVGGCVGDVNAHDCAATFNGFYGGDDSDCGSISCTGACCTPVDCQQTSLDDCVMNLDGTFQGVNSDCESTSCLGACCDPTNGSCFITSQSDCENNFGGTFHGGGTSCVPFPCPEVGLGACCLPGGGCTQLSQTDCADNQGHFQGVGVLCNDPHIDCPNVGRCCFTDGSCMTTSVDYCFNDLGGGAFSTPGTCDTFPCPNYGACCHSDGGCSLEWDFVCTGPDKSFQGPGTNCSPSPCGCSCPGDMNGDGRVNGDDVQQFVNCYVAGFGGPPQAGCNCADVQPNFLIDSGDLLAFVNELLHGGACPN